ncbi:type VI secretion system-associated protein TagF [Massilia sp. TS11]|uniref:type VI secretion system-associated protein TagF n=1 Tax=Massilia sp. TS11 TaxID=2908003 RepID=UPI001EDA747F|nr:type VI secretion system-associated protein TagF [Massilia sp. TS11]MCG2584206.1 type VI secretion system-associated protein TagF [Massilia sp. TS11]
MTTDTRLTYFGKLPSRGDFVGAAPGQGVVQAIDQWLAATLQSLQANPRWKLIYDALPPTDFAFVGPRRRHAIAGHFQASRDQAGRRFPFVVLQLHEGTADAGAVAESAVHFSPFWQAMPPQVSELIAAANPATRLQHLCSQSVAPAHPVPTADWTLEALAASLDMPDLPRLIVALGLLLQPLADRPDAPACLGKALVLPMPDAWPERSQAAWFWLSLLEPFIAGTDVELLQLYTRFDGRPVLLLDFHGASASSLLGAMDPLAGAMIQVRFHELGWLDAALGSALEARQLAAFLAQPRLPLGLARELFLHTFLKRDVHA